MAATLTANFRFEMSSLTDNETRREWFATGRKDWQVWCLRQWLLDLSRKCSLNGRTWTTGSLEHSCTHCHQAAARMPDMMRDRLHDRYLRLSKLPQRDGSATRDIQVVRNENR